MMNLSRIVALTLVIGSMQGCTGNPVVSDAKEKIDVTKLFTADELQRARNAGILDYYLVNGRRRGVSVDEMIQLSRLAENSQPAKDDDLHSNDTRSPTTFNEMTKVCNIFFPQHKTVTNYTKDQEARLNELMKSVDHFPRDIQFPYLKASVCPYLSEPIAQEVKAESFGLKLIPYLKFRYWKSKHQNTTGVERVNAAKELCCIFESKVNFTESKVESSAFILSEQKMADFGKHWNDFETSNTSQYFKHICELLRATDLSYKC